MKRKATIVTLALMLVFSLAFIAACGDNNNPEPPPEQEQPIPQSDPDPIPTPEPDLDPEPYPQPPDYEIGSLYNPQHGLVWSLSRDDAVQMLAIGQVGTGEDLFAGTDFLQASGNPAFSVVPSPFGGSALQVSSRNENRAALDIVSPFLHMDFANNAYQIIVLGSVAEPDGTTVIISGADEPWNWFITGIPNQDGSFVLNGFFSQETLDASTGGWAQFENSIRIQTNNLTNYTIYEIVILEVPVNHVWSLASDLAIQNHHIGAAGTGEDIFARTPFLQAAGDPMFTVIGTGFGSNALSVSFRPDSGAALDLVTRNLGMDVDVNEYHITIFGRVTDTADTQVILAGAGEPQNWLFFSAPDASGEFTIEGIISRTNWEATSGGSAQFEQGMRIMTNNTTNFELHEISIVRVME